MLSINEKIIYFEKYAFWVVKKSILSNFLISPIFLFDLVGAIGFLGSVHIDYLLILYRDDFKEPLNAIIQCFPVI